MRDYIVLACLAVAIPASAINPYGGILAWTIASYLNPHQFAWGIARSFPVAYLIAIPTLLGLIFTHKRQFPPVVAETVLMILLWVWFAITSVSVYFSVQLSAHVADTITRLWLVSKILLMTFVALVLVNSARRLRTWYLVTAFVFAFFFIKSAVFAVVTGGHFKVYGPDNSFIADNNDFGLASNMCLPIFVYLLIRDENRWIRRLGWVSFGSGIIAILITYSRGALVGLAATLLVMGIKSRRKVLSVVTIIVVTLGVLAFAPQAWLDRMSTIETAAQSDASTLSRFRSWKLATRIATDHPIFGGGFETFTDDLYHYYELPGPKAWGPHSIYFQVLGEHGFIGLLLYLLLLGTAWRSSSKLIRAGRQLDGGEMFANMGHAVQASLIGFASSGAFLGRAYFDFFFQIIAMLVISKSLAYAADRQPAPDPGLGISSEEEALRLSADLAC